jgi:hypothetical protein
MNGRSSPSPGRAALDVARRVGRAFLLGDALGLAERLAAGAREQLSVRLDLVAQKRASAEILAASDQPAEALALAESALALVLDAAGSAAVRAALGAAAIDPEDPREDPTEDPTEDPREDPTPRWAPSLSLLGAAPAQIAQLAAAAEAAEQPRPAHNHAVTPACEQRTRNALAATELARRRLHKLARPPGQITAARGVRVGAAATLALGALAYLVASHLDSGLIGVSAKISYDATTHGPSMAVDGDPNTEWLLPNRTTGAIEIHLHPRRLHEVRLRNAHNGAYADRATRDFHIECYRDGKLVHKSAGSFPRFEPAPAWTRWPTDVPSVDTLKIVVDSYHKSGGGLAEISWD